MEKENLHDEIVIDEGRKQYNILTFQDFVLEEGKKGKEIKNREEFTNDQEDIIDPNDHPERFIKLREQFIEEYLE